MSQPIQRETLNRVFCPFMNLILTPIDLAMVLSEALRRNQVAHRVVTGKVAGAAVPHPYEWLAPAVIWLEVGGWCVDTTLHFDQLEGHLSRIGIYHQCNSGGRQYQPEAEVVPVPIEKGLFDALCSPLSGRACMELAMSRPSKLVTVPLVQTAAIEQGA